MHPMLKSPLSLVPVVALAFAACSSNSTEPKIDEAQVQTDLKSMAANIKYLSASVPGESQSSSGGLLKRAAGDCAQEGLTVDTYMDTSAAGVTTSTDSTWNYTSSNKLVCAEDDETAYDIIHSHDENASYISAANVRTDYTQGTGFFPSMKISGTGTVHYKSGYDIAITAINANLDFTAGKFDVSENLSLEDGRYQVVLKMNASLDMMSDTEPGPKDVVASGAITHGSQTVGYFEVLGDDSVVIRDADKVVVETHA